MQSMAWHCLEHAHVLKQKLVQADASIPLALFLSEAGLPGDGVM